jgi:hypothetical protein
MNFLINTGATASSSHEYEASPKKSESIATVNWKKSESIDTGKLMKKISFCTLFLVHPILGLVITLPLASVADDWFIS